MDHDKTSWISQLQSCILPFTVTDTLYVCHSYTSGQKKTVILSVKEGKSFTKE